MAAPCSQRTTCQAYRAQRLSSANPATALPPPPHAHPYAHPDESQAELSNAAVLVCVLDATALPTHAKEAAQVLRLSHSLSQNQPLTQNQPDQNQPEPEPA